MHVHPDKNGHPRAREAFDALRTAKEEMETVSGGGDGEYVSFGPTAEEFAELFREDMRLAQEAIEAMRARETWWWWWW